MWNIKTATEALLNGCVIKSDNGVNMYTPDGRGNYPSLWTRDFAYMVEYANDLMTDSDIEAAIDYLIFGVDSNGWVPDRVQIDCIPRYTAGGEDFPALPNLDNGCFLVLAADAFLNRLPADQAAGWFSCRKNALVRGIMCLPTDDKEMILNATEPLHSPYGFTDTVAKGGALCFETLLLWRAKKALIKWLSNIGESTEALQLSVQSIERYFTDVFMDKSGMLLAATKQCRQIDVWASCYAVSVGFPLTESEKSGIAKWLITHYNEVVQNGQIRHLPLGEYWEKTFIPVEEGTYQNGAFWATPTGWFADAIAQSDRALALKTIRDALQYFENYGIFECVNGDYRKLDTYVASATNIYGACKRYGIVSV